MADNPDRPSDDAGRRPPDDDLDGTSAPGPQPRSEGEPPAPAGRPRGEPPAPTEHPRDEPPPTPLTQQLGRIALVLLAVVFGVFAVANSHPVDFSWLVGETEVVEAADGTRGGVPLIILLLASFAIGALLGALFEWQLLHRRSRPRRSDDRRGRKGR